MKILAIHGFWRSGIFWKKAIKILQAFGHDVIAPDFNWQGNYIEHILRTVRAEKPDVIMGMSLGGYAVQQVFERLEGREIKCCVLIAPVGPHGLGFRTFLKMLMKGPDRKTDDSELMAEKITSAWRALPFCGSVRRSIGAPTLVISGGQDKFVSREDALRIAAFHNASHMHWPELNHNELGGNREVIQYIARWIAEQFHLASCLPAGRSDSQMGRIVGAPAGRQAKYCQIARFVLYWFTSGSSGFLKI